VAARPGRAAFVRIIPLCCSTPGPARPRALVSITAEDGSVR